MSDFDNFYSQLDNLVKSFKKNDVMIKMEPDLESQIIRIFGENITALGKAKTDRKSTRLNSSHVSESRMPSSA